MGSGVRASTFAKASAAAEAMVDGLAGHALSPRRTGDGTGDWKVASTGRLESPPYGVGETKAVAQVVAGQWAGRRVSSLVKLRQALQF